MIIDEITSPLGNLVAGVDTSDSLVLLQFMNQQSMEEIITSLDEQFGPVDQRSHPVLDQVQDQLSEYFAGQRQQFTIPIKFVGTDFQRQVWQGLTAIPYGDTWSYGQLAKYIGRSSGSSQAVGRANGANHISIIVPCHRVIGADGALVGYAAGIDRKRWLLEHEANKSPTLDDYF